ncbi:MAG: hypothetical protein MZV70_42830 [Desulfobacterales bacterium]|nr:hypothetical protein [Desulfobacterales bacterium]
MQKAAALEGQRPAAGAAGGRGAAVAAVVEATAPAPPATDTPLGRRRAARRPDERDAGGRRGADGQHADRRHRGAQVGRRRDGQVGGADGEGPARAQRDAEDGRVVHDRRRAEPVGWRRSGADRSSGVMNALPAPSARRGPAGTSRPTPRRLQSALSAILPGLPPRRRCAHAPNRPVGSARRAGHAGDAGTGPAAAGQQPDPQPDTHRLRLRRRPVDRPSRRRRCRPPDHRHRHRDPSLLLAGRRHAGLQRRVRRQPRRLHRSGHGRCSAPPDATTRERTSSPAGRPTASASCSRRRASARTRDTAGFSPSPPTACSPKPLPLPMADEGAMLARRRAHRVRRPSRARSTSGNGTAAARPRPSGLRNSPTRRIERVPRADSERLQPDVAGGRARSVFFLSDRDGPVTLYAYDTAREEGGPRHGQQRPRHQVGLRGPDAIVYEQFGGLYLFDLKGGQSRQGGRPRGGRPGRRARRVRAGGARGSPTTRCRPPAPAPCSRPAARSSACPPRRATCATSPTRPARRTATRRGRPTAAGSRTSRDESGEYALHLRDQTGRGEVKKIAPQPCRRRSTTRPRGRPTARRSRSTTSGSCALVRGRSTSGAPVRDRRIARRRRRRRWPRPGRPTAAGSPTRRC